jgi:hypothetical protein
MMSEERRRRFYRNRIRRIRRDMASLGFTTTMTDDKLEAALFLVTQTRRVFSERRQEVNANDYFDAWVRMGHRARASAIVPERRHEHPTEEPDGAYVVPGMRVTFNTNGSDRTVAPSGWNSHQRDGEISVWSDSGTSYNGTASLYTYQGRKVLGYAKG